MNGCRSSAAGCQSPELLEPVYRPLDLVTGTVDDSIKGTRSMSVLLTGDGDPYPPPESVPADLPAAAPFVADDSSRSLLGSDGPNSLDGPRLHQRLEDSSFMLLAWGRDEGHRLAVTFSSQVHLGGEATPAST